MITMHTLTHLERTTRDTGIQAIRGFQDGIGGHTAEMVSGQRRAHTIRPQGQESYIRLLKVEGDRELVGRDIGRGNQVVADSAGCTKLGVIPELPGIIDIISSVCLTIGPLQARLHLDRPCFEIRADVTICNGGYF